MAERVEQRWTVGPYTFEEVSGHPFEKLGPLMYRYTINGQRVDSELYASLDRTLVAAVGARHMGPRSAGGPGVGTPADWFCKMIDLDEAEAEERAPREASEGAPARCSGSSKGWMSSTNAPDPACRECGATPEELGTAKPQRRVRRGFLGLVPPHAEPKR